jgi:hypothetical protein
MLQNDSKKPDANKRMNRNNKKIEDLTARLGGHDGNDVLLGVDPDLGELDVVREHFPLVDELDREDGVELILALDALLNFGDALVGVALNQLDSLVGRDARQTEPVLDHFFSTRLDEIEVWE